jgi:hypothetical protein
MDEGARDGVMRGIRAIYGKDDSVLKSFMYEPVERYLWLWWEAPLTISALSIIITDKNFVK